MSRTALIAGATGATSKRLVEILIVQGWNVIGVSRNPPPGNGRLRYIRANLLDGRSAIESLRECSTVTHVFFTARAKHGETGNESVADNTAMLRNTLDGIEPVAAGLAHVHLVQGGKYYGAHLGPFPTPAREDDARHMPPNFYYDQQDLLAERQRGRDWAWSVSRPDFVWDLAPERARNMVSVIATYAAITAELDLPFDFPGTQACFDAIKQATDATHLARAMIFIASTPACANQAFNVTNGDLFRWNRLWPKIAAHFKLKEGVTRPMTLADVMADKDALWQRIVDGKGGVPQPLKDTANWHYADAQWSQGYDTILSTTKLRRAGFHEVVDTEEMLLTQLSQHRDAISAR